MTELRVLHWNVHSWADDAGKPNGDRVAGLISRTNPDVVSLAEVDELFTGTGTLAEVAASCGYTPVFCPAFEFGDKDNPRGAFGNALLTRLPVRAVRHRHLLWPVPSYDGSEASEARTITLADLSTDLGAVTVATTHLPRGDQTARTAAIARLASIVTAFPRWLVAGDFNTPPEWVHEHGMTAAPASAATYPAANPNEPIDYIVTAPPLRADAEALDEAASDHFPVLATVTFREERHRTASAPGCSSYPGTRR
jgi:endonuclease/exonuclease/phosphatase family metal-dependent hydrolase